MTQSEIDALRVAVGARTDIELARQLGIERSTVAQWKRRGRVPDRYRFLIEAQPDLQAVGLHVARLYVFGKPERHYWLRAALAFLPPGFDTKATEAEREELLTSLMLFALNVTMNELGKAVCEDDNDFRQLVERMAKSRVTLEQIWTRHGFREVPQSAADSVPQSTPQSTEGERGLDREALNSLRKGLGLPEAIAEPLGNPPGAIGESGETPS